MIDGNVTPSGVVFTELSKTKSFSMRTLLTIRVGSVLFCLANVLLGGKFLMQAEKNMTRLILKSTD